MAAPTVTTTASILESTHPLPVYDGDRDRYTHTTPTSISVSSKTRRYPTNICYVPPSNLVSKGRRYANRPGMAGIVDERKIVSGSRTLERRTEQCAVSCFDTHVVRPVMELFSHGFETNKHRSDAHRIQHTWEPQLTLPDIPKPVDPDESNKGSKSKTHKRRKISYDFSNTNDDDDDGEPRYVSVRPDMIVVRTKRGERMDMGEGKREAPSRCISVLEMKREGVLSCRVSNLKSVAGMPVRLPPVTGANRRFARGGRHNTCMKTSLDPGSVNLIKQAIVYALTFRVCFVVISDYNTTAFFQFTEMKTGARVGIKKLWETGVGESMDMSILEEDESADVRAAWLGFLASADAELNKSLY